MITVAFVPTGLCCVSKQKVNHTRHGTGWNESLGSGCMEQKRLPVVSLLNDDDDDDDDDAVVVV